MSQVITTAASGEGSSQALDSILFTTIAAGGSHVSTATAMAQAVTRHEGNRFEPKVFEPMPEYGFERLDRRHKAGWRRALENPWTIVWGQRLLDAFPAGSIGFHRALLRSFARKAAQVLNEQDPALVVANHGWLTVAMTLAQREFGLRVPVLNFETSTMNANALWADPQAERFIVASHVSRDLLIRFGLPADRVDVVGYPVREQFLNPPSKSAAREELQLPPGFVCLVSLGGEGVGGESLEIAKILTDDPENVVLVIAGRNERLKEQLEQLARERPNLRVVGFVNDVATYLAAADVVVGKTGPATVYETLAVGRPLFAPNTFGMAENKLLAMLERNDLGGYTPVEQLPGVVAELRANPERLDEIKAKTAALDFPGMAERIARYISHYAQERTPAREVCGEGVGSLHRA